MKKLLLNEDILKLDSLFSKVYKIPSLVLMENASQKSALKIISLFEKNKKFVFFLGSQNNAGDGACIAREMFFAGYEVALLRVINKANENLETHLKICKNLGIAIHSVEDIDEEFFFQFDCFVDCIYGTGLKGKIKNESVQTFIEQINKIDKIKIAIDIPSGLHSYPNVLDVVLKADFTISIGASKLAFYYPFSRRICGKIFDVDIGFLSKIEEHGINFVQLIEEEPLKIEISSESYKTKRGRLLICAGSKDYSLAAYLLASSASKTPCGYVNLIAFKEVFSILVSKLNAEVVSVFEEEKIEKKIKSFDVICAGSGLIDSKDSNFIFQKLIKSELPLVLDAYFIGKLKNRDFDFQYKSIITPHPKEMQDLMGLKSTQEILDNPFENCKILSKKYKIIVVLKMNITIICKGDDIYVIEGNMPNLAVAGSGDVLAGLIAGFYAFLKNPLKSALMGVYHHKIAGIKASEKYGFFSADKIFENIFVESKII